jgi:DNA helicase-2/ATP-dependent DNA helicase PcrA
VAVFYRTNAQSRVFEEVFIRTGQPYKVVGGVRFYERREVRDALGVPADAGQPGRRGVLARILNTPKRGIGDRAVDCVQPLASGAAPRSGRRAPRGGRAGLATRSLTNIKGFVAMVEELQSDGRRGGSGPT